MTRLLPRRSSRSRAAFAVAAAATLALALSACANNGGSTGSGSVGGPDPVGTWGTVETTGVPFLTFTDDGQFTGSDGCNTLNGGWELNGTTIDFENVATTLMACQGVDTWLSELNTATIDGATMTVFNESGSEIGTLDNVSSDGEDG